MTTEAHTPEVRMTIEGHVCVISLDNVSKKNAITPELMSQLSAHLTTFEGDDDLCRRHAAVVSARRVRDRALVKLRRGRHVVRKSAGQVVHDVDLVAERRELVRDVRPDESGTAGHERARHGNGQAWGCPEPPPADTPARGSAPLTCS